MNSIYKISAELKEIMNEHGYSFDESLKIIEVAALRKIADCIDTGYDGKPYLRISGNVATYEQ